MNMDELREAWKAQTNGLKLNLNEIEDAVKADRRAARGRAAILGLCGFNVIASLVFTIYVIRQRGGQVLEEAWPAFLIQCASLALVCGLWRRQARLRRRIRNYSQTVKGALEGILSQTISEIKGHRLVVIFIWLLLPIFYWIGARLHDAGKMRAQDMWSLLAMCAVIAIANLGWFLWRTHRQMAPRKTRIEEMLRALGDS